MMEQSFSGSGMMRKAKHGEAGNENTTTGTDKLIGASRDGGEPWEMRPPRRARRPILSYQERKREGLALG